MLTPKQILEQPGVAGTADLAIDLVRENKLQRDEIERLRAKAFGMAREIERLKTENDLRVPKATTDSQSVTIK